MVVEAFVPGDFMYRRGFTGSKSQLIDVMERGVDYLAVSMTPVK